MSFRRIMAFVLVVIMIISLVPTLVYAVEAEEDKDKEAEKKILKHIFMITLEGISTDDLLAAYTPNINRLANLGIRGDAVGVLPPDTGSFLQSLYSGVTPQRDSGKKFYLSLPAVLDSNGRPSVIVDNGTPKLSEQLKGIKRVQPKESLDYQTADKSIMELAVLYFNQERPFFTSIVLPGTELARQKYPPSSKQVITVTNRADEQVGRLLKEIKSQGIFDNCLFVVTGSSSKNTVDNGKLNLKKLVVPVIISGPGIHAGGKIPPVRIIDVSPTLALLAGVSLSPEADGLVLWNILDSGQGISKESLLGKRLKELSQAHLNSIENSYELLSERDNIQLEKERINHEKGQIEERIYSKQKEIDHLKFKLNAFKGLGLIFLAVAAAGYVLEYLILRKKFLMF